VGRRVETPCHSLELHITPSNFASLPRPRYAVESGNLDSSHEEWVEVGGIQSFQNTAAIKYKKLPKNNDYIFFFPQNRTCSVVFVSKLDMRFWPKLDIDVSLVTWKHPVREHSNLVSGRQIKIWGLRSLSLMKFPAVGVPEVYQITTCST